MAVCILVVAASAIAINDPNFRDRFFELVLLALGGYFGQMNPQSHK